MSSRKSLNKYSEARCLAFVGASLTGRQVLLAIVGALIVKNKSYKCQYANSRDLETNLGKLKYTAAKKKQGKISDMSEKWGDKMQQTTEILGHKLCSRFDHRIRG